MTQLEYTDAILARDVLNTLKRPMMPADLKAWWDTADSDLNKFAAYLEEGEQEAAEIVYRRLRKTLKTGFDIDLD